jgi:hypothetical protein
MDDNIPVRWERRGLPLIETHERFRAACKKVTDDFYAEGMAREGAWGTSLGEITASLGEITDRLLRDYDFSDAMAADMLRHGVLYAS